MSVAFKGEKRKGEGQERKEGLLKDDQEMKQVRRGEALEGTVKKGGGLTEGNLDSIQVQIERVARRAEATTSTKRKKTVAKVTSEVRPAEERKILRKTSGDTIPDAGGHAFAGEGVGKTAAEEVMHTRCICGRQGQMEE